MTNQGIEREWAVDFGVGLCSSRSPIMTACRWGFEEGAVGVRSKPVQGVQEPFGCGEAD